MESLDSRKANKLLTRTTILDKIKQDIGGKNTDRCMSMIDPSKLDSKVNIDKFEQQRSYQEGNFS